MVADRTAFGEVGSIAHGDRGPDDTADARIAAMRRLLDAMPDLSPAEALGALRVAFPEAPLDERVRALRDSRH